MTEQEKDELLYRVDERLKGLHESCQQHFQEIKERLDEINGRGRDNRNRIIRLEVLLFVTWLVFVGLKLGGISI